MSVANALAIYQTAQRPPMQYDLTRISNELTEDVRRHVRKQCGSSQQVDREIIANYAMGCVLRAVRERRLPEDAEGFRRYLYVVIRNGILDGVREMKGDAEPTSPLLEIDGPVRSSLDDRSAALLEAVTEQVMGICSRNNRFSEVDDGLVRYIVRQRMASQPIAPRTLKLIGGPAFHERPAWYMAYVEMLMRWALYQLRETVEIDA